MAGASSPKALRPGKASEGCCQGFRSSLAPVRRGVADSSWARPLRPCWPGPNRGRRLDLTESQALKWSKATKDELYEIAGAFAKLASTPKGPGAAEIYEEVEATLGGATWLSLSAMTVGLRLMCSDCKAIEKWEGGTISAKAIVEERARLRLGRARARVVYNDLLQGTRPDKAGYVEL